MRISSVLRAHLARMRAHRTTFALIALRNEGLGWFVTTVIWALLHAPKWYGESHDITEALLSSIRIIPIGLM